jgi:SAM-dependent methyltransferase
MKARLQRHLEHGLTCCDPVWEAAYQRFETPEEELRKFLGRYRWFKLASMPKSSMIVELFCGRGNGLHALARLGFTRLHGVDLSEQLLEQYTGPADLHLADCRSLPFADNSVDLAVVHGGLHHLPDLAVDLPAVIEEVARVLRADGRFLIVEPWRTPFLTWVHRITDLPWVRRCWTKADALATMTERERFTYERWLDCSDQILEMLAGSFHPLRQRIAYGKLYWIGTTRRG